MSLEIIFSQILSYLWLTTKAFSLVLALCVLPYFVFAVIMQLITHFIRINLANLIGLKAYIYLTAPGVIIHELSHAFFCIIFGHKIVEMKLFSPEKDGTLGYVNHSYNPKNLFHRIGNLFIGTGPIWGGMIFLYITTYLLLPEHLLNFNNGILVSITNFFKFLASENFWLNWQSFLWLYLVITISSHITLSSPDIKGATAGAVFLLITIFLVVFSLTWHKAANQFIIYNSEKILLLVMPILIFSLFITIFFALLLFLTTQIIKK